jgi:hypothetical protein
MMLLGRVPHARTPKPTRPRIQTRQLLMFLTAHSNIRLHNPASHLRFIHMSCRGD